MPKCIRAINPYPAILIDESSGQEVPDIRHQLWQEGYEAAWNEAKRIVQNVNTEAGDLKVFERMILAAFVPPEKRRNHAAAKDGPPAG